MIEDNNHLAAALLVSMPLMNYPADGIATCHHPLWASGRDGTDAVRGGRQLLARSLAGAGGGVRLLLAEELEQDRVGHDAWRWLWSVAIAFMPESWVERMHSIEEYQEDASAMGRLEIWHVAWVMATSRPLVGGRILRDVFGSPWSISSCRARDAGSAQHLVGGSRRAWLSHLLRLDRHQHCRGGLCPAYHQAGHRRAGLEWCVNLAKMTQVSMIAYLSVAPSCRYAIGTITLLS